MSDLSPPPAPDLTGGDSGASGIVRAWEAFGGLPTWSQAILWLLGWPLLAATFVWLQNSDGFTNRVVAAFVFAIGSLLWPSPSCSVSALGRRAGKRNW